MKQKHNKTDEDVQEAVWREEPKSISVVWIVPIVAIIIGAWLIYQSFNERGPKIKIVFQSAEGVEAEKTVIKYKDIEVGKVTDVTFGKELQTVIVTAELKKNMKPFLSENSRFWVMRARLGLNNVEGLDTLLSGVYIVIDPKKGNKKVKEFKGLEEIPILTSKEKGTSFILKADSIGSIDVGSPIYYKKLKAGSVVSYKLEPDGQSVAIEIFIHNKFEKLITDKTRFWNASGISASIGTNGVDIQTESLTSILVGGLSFDTPKTGIPGKTVKDKHTFKLYANYKDAQSIHYSRELLFWVYFDHTIRGLSVGAPVEFRGVKVGEVVNFSLIEHTDSVKFTIPILIKIEPERFKITGSNTQKGNNVDSDTLKRLVGKGLRAQLQSGSLLTGELFIDLNLHSDVPPATLKKENGYYVLPSIPATMESLKSDVKSLLANLSSIPFKDIGTELNTTIAEIRKELSLTLKDIRLKTLPSVNDTFASTKTLMRSTNKFVKEGNRPMRDLSRLLKSAKKNYTDSNGQVNKKLIKLLNELTKTSRSVKHLTDYLERHPESLIQGK